MFVVSVTELEYTLMNSISLTPVVSEPTAYCNFCNFMFRRCSRLTFQKTQPLTINRCVIFLVGKVVGWEKLKVKCQNIFFLKLWFYLCYFIYHRDT